jgi:hypothetical protein
VGGLNFSDGLRLTSEWNQCHANQFSRFVSHSHWPDRRQRHAGWDGATDKRKSTNWIGPSRASRPRVTRSGVSPNPSQLGCFISRVATKRKLPHERCWVQHFETSINSRPARKE